MAPCAKLARIHAFCPPLTMSLPKSLSVRRNHSRMWRCWLLTLISILLVQVVSSLCSWPARCFPNHRHSKVGLGDPSANGAQRTPLTHLLRACLFRCAEATFSLFTASFLEQNASDTRRIQLSCVLFGPLMLLACLLLRQSHRLLCASVSFQHFIATILNPPQTFEKLSLKALQIGATCTNFSNCCLKS